MEVHEAAGNPAEALRAFEELRSLLREELGTTPGPAAMTVFERVLRGEPPPVHRAAVAAARRAGRAGRPRPWPAPLAAAVDRHALVGRGVELAYLERCWREATDGQRALVLLAGDAGIGKTRLAAELARARARRRRGRPLRALRRGDADAVPAGGGDAARLVGGRAAGLAARAARPARGRARRSCCRSSGRRRRTIDRRRDHGPEADAQRFRFFDAVAALIGEIGAEAPVVLVFDDLHWADRPTLQLLRHLVRSPAPRRVLFLGTYRESEISDRHPLHELIGDLRREGTLRRLELAGLAEPEVGELVAELASAPAVGVVRARAGGRDRGQPVLHRGGRAPHPRHRGRAVARR